MKAGNQTLLKLNNQRALVDYIIKNGAISRADLSKALKVSKPTISGSVTELIGQNILQETGFSVTEIGKRPIMVDFNHDIKLVVALDFISYITKSIVSVAVCNLAYEIVFTDTIQFVENYSADYLRDNLPQMLVDIFKKNKISMDRIGVVVTTAPTASYSQQHLPFTCRTGERVNLLEILSKAFTKKIIVKNDINLAAIGEKHFGVGKQVESLIFVWAGVAVGGGLIINGKLYEGLANGGGELAFTMAYDEISNDNIYLKDILSMSGVRKYINFYADKAKNSCIADKLFSEKLSIEDMITAAHSGDEFCNCFAKYIAKKLANIICNLCATVDLEMAIIGGEYSRFGHVLTDELVRRIELMPITHTQITTPMYSNSAMYGAFQVGGEYVIKNLIE